MVQLVLEKGPGVLRGTEALERLSQGSVDEVHKRIGAILAEIKNVCCLQPVLVEEVEKYARSEVAAKRAATKSRADHERTVRRCPRRRGKHRKVISSLTRAGHRGDAGN